MTSLPAGHRVRVAALVHNAAGEILCVRHFNRGLPFWTLPGGAPKEGESLDAAIVREVAEETGCSISLEGVVGVGSLRSDRWTPVKVEIFFTAVTTSQSLPRTRAGESIVDVRFFKPEEIPDPFRPWEALAFATGVPSVSHIELELEDDA